MKKVSLLILGMLVALPALLVAQTTDSKIESTNAQAAASANAIQNERKFALVEIMDNDSYVDSMKVLRLITDVIYIHEGSITKQQLPPDTAKLYIAEDGVTQYVGTTTWHENAKFDTTWTELSRIDDPATNTTGWNLLTNISKAANVSGKEVYNKSFSYVTVASSKSVLELKPVAADRLEFFSEHYPGHGLVKVFVDGADGSWVQIATLNQNSTVPVTDFSRMQPSFYYIWPKELYNSPLKLHKIKFETEPGNQYLMDFVRVVKMTLTPKVRK